MSASALPSALSNATVLNAPLDPHATLRMLDVGVVVQDQHLRIIYANPKATAMLGLTADEITARTTVDERWDVVDGDGHPVPEHGHPGPRALRTGDVVSGVVLGVRRGDAPDRVWIMVSAVPGRDDSGQVTQVIISFSDVSVAQRTLRSHEAIYQSAFRSMSEGLVIHSMDGTIREANLAAERVLGLTVAQMKGTHPMDPSWRLVRPDGSDVGPDGIPSEITRRTGEPSQAILGVYRPTGELAWLDVRADPVTETGERGMAGVLATFTDITAERDARLALETSRTQIQRVLDGVPGVVYQLLYPPGEIMGRFTYAAGRIEEVTGLDAEAVRRDPNLLFSLFDEDARLRVRHAIESARRTGTNFEQVISFRPVRGDQRWVRTFGVPEETPAGVLYTGVILDVTHEQQMADALRRRQRREAMGDMAGGVAHNFNNMLAVILPNVQLAREEAPPGIAQHLADAEKAAVNAADLVRRMLALGRGDGADTTAVVDLVPIVREALHICRQTFDRSIEITDELRVAQALVRGSESTMQQVVLNLLLNARDAMQGLPRATLLVRLARGDRDMVQFVVTDTGTGMSRETQERIGEPFFTTKPPGRGTGLGLASAFHSIAESGGTWQVHSVEGEGTTLTVTLPQVSGVPVMSAPVVAASTPRWSGAVLVIDDERMVRTALVRQLSRTGLDSTQAEDAESALRLLAQGIPNLRLILLDLSMPGMSGVDALPLLQKAAPGVPVIALSGHIPDDAPLQGAAAVLQKPLGLADLLSALRAVLGD